MGRSGKGKRRQMARPQGQSNSPNKRGVDSEELAVPDEWDDLENPYLTLFRKKMRGTKKKVQKMQALQEKDPSTLNEDQKASLSLLVETRIAYNTMVQLSNECKLIAREELARRKIQQAEEDHEEEEEDEEEEEVAQEQVQQQQKEDQEDDQEAQVQPDEKEDEYVVVRQGQSSAGAAAQGNWQTVKNSRGPAPAPASQAAQAAQPAPAEAAKPKEPPSEAQQKQEREFLLALMHVSNAYQHTWESQKALLAELHQIGLQSNHEELNGLKTISHFLQGHIYEDGETPASKFKKACVYSERYLDLSNDILEVAGISFERLHIVADAILRTPTWQTKLINSFPF